jgi:TrmH family RNA methyltransferase
MGTHFRLPLHICHTWQQVWEQLPSSIALYVAEAHAERHYDQVNWQAPAALAIGSEAHGPSQEVRQRATPLTIPMQGGVESLNAAVAGAVILFEAARQRRLKHS